ncbi:DUF58 domain-containing protein [Acetobacter tropicalis]|uniref:DUF58 domain-containing protein n=1 Tax=Acetobacter tropicalis TaxID=104102 RepID=A0A252ADX3_9PROT|nr:DUF58 domain-containing protein [Acetobacter tropicalis]OUI87713.1 hypothetical protein HC62_04850 [Acetobacter tropicalis]
MAQSAFSPTFFLRKVLGRSVERHHSGPTAAFTSPSGLQPDAPAGATLQGQASGIANQASSLAARLPDLVLQADHIAATLYAGQHGQRRAGWGDTFWQYRQAQPGEPATHIDWRQSARSTHAYVRETEAESAQTILLWCDLSPSMQWRSASSLPEKRDRAVLLQLAMAALLLRNGERVRLLAPSGMAPMPASGTPLERLALGLAHMEASSVTHPAGALPPVTLVPRHAHILIASDFLCADEALVPCLRHMAGLPARAHLIQIADPAELSLPYQGRVEFEGLEQEAPVDLPHVQTLRQNYESLVIARNTALAAQAATYGHDLVLHCTQDAALPTLLALHGLISGRPGSHREGRRI